MVPSLLALPIQLSYNLKSVHTVVILITKGRKKSANYNAGVLLLIYWGYYVQYFSV